VRTVSHSFDLASTYVHLGDGGSAVPLPDFEWSPSYLEEYGARFADSQPSRLVCLLEQSATWDQWERHPAGEELVVLVSGRVDVIQDIDGAETLIELRPGEALVNPPTAWHRSIVHEPGRAIFVTPGGGTENRPL
jgi:hypothetical protein